MSTRQSSPQASLVVLLLLSVGCASGGGGAGQPPSQVAQATAAEWGDEDPHEGLAIAGHEPRQARRLALTPLQQQESGPTPEQQAMLDDNCPFGAPQRTQPDGVFWEHGPTHMVYRDGYVLEHGDIDKIPLWVCERVTAQEAQGNVPRPDPGPFKADPQLNDGERAEKADYHGSGFDRGHMAPAGNQRSSQRLVDETFFLSNMAPQIGIRFNRHAWKQLELLVRDWAIERGSAFVITGGLFFDPEEENGATADGMIEYFTIGPGEVAVPTHFYKIVVAQDDNGQWEAIAFVMEHRRHNGPHKFANHIETIDWIEKQTALDFMPTLDPIVENNLENQTSTMW